MVQPGIDTLDLFLGPAGFILFALVTAAIGGLLRGKDESDKAKSGNVVYKDMENITLLDWCQDAGVGLAGGLFCLYIAQATPGIELLAIFFGYAGRMILINVSKKAESSSEQTTK